MLSQEIQARLEIAAEKQNRFVPNEATALSISHKVLGMLVAPSTGGKSHAISEVTTRSPEYAAVIDFTSRPPRDDDEAGLFRYTPHTDEGVAKLLDLIEDSNGSVVQYAVHPKHGFIYGTTAADYPLRYNLLPTLHQTVSGLSKLPFERTETMFLVTDSNLWSQRFAARFPADNPLRKGRLEEGISCLEWALAQDPESIHWVYNTNNSHDVSIQIEKIMKEQALTSIRVRKLAEHMLRVANTMTAN